MKNCFALPLKWLIARKCSNEVINNLIIKKSIAVLVKTFDQKETSDWSITKHAMTILVQTDLLNERFNKKAHPRCIQKFSHPAS